MVSAEPTIQLRPYQQECLEAIEHGRKTGVRSGLIVLPTGCGKTTVFAELISRMSGEPDFEALILAHREELLSQGANRIAEQNPSLIISTEAGSSRAVHGADVVVAGVQTIGRPNTDRLSWLRPQLIVTDEAHHAAADTYVTVYRRFGVWEPDVNVFHLGVTATPHRLDNKPLHGSEQAIFDEVLFKYTLRDAIRDKWLCDLRGYRTMAEGLDLSGVKKTAGDYNQGQLQEKMNTDPVNEHAFKSWADVARDRQTIVFCTGVQHARDMAEVFRSRGIAAASIDGGMRQDDRARILRQFKSREIQVLTNVDIATEGFDYPALDCVLLLRPTQSWALYTQMVGRGTRLSPGKTDCIIIDVVGNTDRHNLGKQPKQGPATLAGLVGLPEQMDLEGHSLEEAIELFEGLDEKTQAALLKRCVNFSGLTVKLQEVDLLAELEVPQELDTASFSWLKTGNDRYLLEFGDSGAESKREAHVYADQLGRWQMHLTSSTRDELIFLGVDLNESVLLAERKLKAQFAGIGALCTRDAKWKAGSPTAKQIGLLKRLKVSDEMIQGLTKGTASALITKLKNEQMSRMN
jgi:ATP-dependent helicase IRC3